MPATPYAKILVSVNGGGPVSGGIEVPSEATIALSAESTVGWTQALWEIVDYPEGWTAPAGWSTASNGTIYSTSITPASFQLPAAAVRWGKWMLRLRVNEQVAESKARIGNLLDEETALSMLSPGGLRDIGAREDVQFTSFTTRFKGWLRDLQRNLRIIEAIEGGPGGGYTPSALAQAFLDDPTSAKLAALVGDETGTGTAVFGTQPTLDRPIVKEIEHPTSHSVSIDGNGVVQYGAGSVVTGVPRLGVPGAGTYDGVSFPAGTPFSSDGYLAFGLFNGGGTHYTISAAQAAVTCLRFNNTGSATARSVYFPLPATDDAAYAKDLINDSDHTVTVAVNDAQPSALLTKTLAPGERGRFWFTSAGVRGPIASASPGGGDPVDLTSDVTGVLPAVNGGTGLGPAGLAANAGKALAVNAAGDDVEPADVLEITGGAGSVGNVLTRTVSGQGWEAPAVQALDDVTLRLTLTSGVPVTASDVTGASTIYLTPAKPGLTNGRIPLWNGTRWLYITTAQVSLALSGLTSGANYDVFAYWTGSAVAVELSAAWANATTRTDALADRDGVLVKSANHTRRLVGTIRTTGTTTTEDSGLKRFVSNVYNRKLRALVRAPTSTTSYAYQNATWRQAEGVAANRVEYVDALGDASVDLTVMGIVRSSGATQAAAVNIGVDSTSAPAAPIYGGRAGSSSEAQVALVARYNGTPGRGYHALNWLERSQASVSINFWPSDATLGVSGLVGSVDA